MSEQQGTTEVEPTGEGAIGPATVQWIETYTVRAHTKPAEVERVSKAHSKHMIFAPDSISATWSRSGGPGYPWTLDQVYASGPRVLKGDRLGQGISEHWTTWSREERPAWIVAWAEQQTLPT